MKAIVLLSGGLDSTLAARIMRDFGLELIALTTVSPFCLCNHTAGAGCFHSSAAAARTLGLKFVAIDVSAQLLELVKKPTHGYGSNMNPCIDCRILLFRKAKEILEKEGASFVITGEVAGQRPMSQKIKTMKLIEEESGLEGLVLRPLSAKVMEETVPEKEGWVSREKLYAISGRGRRPQMALAEELGINDYPCPAGGCLLTDAGFSRRLKDAMKHGNPALPDVHLMKVGRHFRLSPQARLIVGRNEKDNARLENLAQEGDYIFLPDENTAGPTALGRGSFTDEIIERACRITARYCDAAAGSAVKIIYKKLPGVHMQSLMAEGAGENELKMMRI